MGLQQSKDELLYQQVSYGNLEGIKSLRREGAGLEWMDSEGKTPLILACLRTDLYHVAEVLISLGANVNAYRPGRHAGTPLHHAAKRGLDHTAVLLLTHGANAFAMNDDCQTPLDVAREKGHTNVVRAIENHICLFSGWLRELHGPGFLGALAPQLLSRKIWAVVVPRDSRNPNNPQKFELAIYPSPQVAQPRTVILLWKASIEELNCNLMDPTLVITDKATKTRYKFLAENEGNKQQIQWFYQACRGMNQRAATQSATTPSTLEDQHLAMAINASVQTAMVENPSTLPTNQGSQTSNFNGWDQPSGHSHPPPKTVDNGWVNDPAGSTSVNGWGVTEAGSSGKSSQNHTQLSNLANPTYSATSPSSVPSAPPIPEDIPYDDGPIHYPSIDDSPIDLDLPNADIKTESSSKPVGSNDDFSCVICLDAPKEGACVPCGHVVGCMNCLNDIKAKDWGCPVCRSKINQVIKLYSV